MAWIHLLVAGLFEIVFALALKAADGLSRPVPLAISFAAMVASLAFLSLALRSMPIGTAYAVWSGIGTVGTAAFGLYLFGEAATPARLGAIAMIAAGIAALKLVDG